MELKESLTVTPYVKLAWPWTETDPAVRVYLPVTGPSAIGSLSIFSAWQNELKLELFDIIMPSLPNFVFVMDIKPLTLCLTVTCNFKYTAEG